MGPRGTGKKVKVLFAIAMLVTALLPQCNSGTHSAAPSKTDEAKAPVVYRNADYGFCVALPQSWKGYSIVLQNWDGRDNTPADSKTITHGPLIAIRNPRWTAQDPHQDIPIMVFTHAQWDSVQNADLVVSAAPFPPSQLGRNPKYVFGLPPRYNYAFPSGFEEVEQILQSGAFHSPCSTDTK